ncbi:MAG: hypothetical protein HGB36_11575 [Chlorobiaceae bacterium]|nr:hypothetical protein [Chlorobiaceae bacterium]
MSTFLAVTSRRFIDLLRWTHLQDNDSKSYRKSPGDHSGRKSVPVKHTPEKGNKRFDSIEDEIIAQMAEENPTIFLS